MTHKAEKSGDTEGFVTVADHFEVDGVVVEKNTNPCDDRVDGDHPENANNTAQRSTCQFGWDPFQLYSILRSSGPPHLLALFNRFTVVGGMAHDQKNGYEAGDQGADAA